MSNSTQIPSAPARQIGIIYDGYFVPREVLHVSQICVVHILQLSLSVFGMCTNIVNILVFAKMSFSNSVIISYLVLSLSDFAFVAGSLLQIIILTLVRVGVKSYVPIHHLICLVQWGPRMFYDVSGLVTVFIALQKCYCVARPLRFKTVFTDVRTFVILLVICSTTAISYVPLYASQGLRWKHVGPYRNQSKLDIWFSEDWQTVFRINDMGNRNVLPTISQIIVLLCLLVLVHRLRAASRFRQQTSTMEKQQDNPEAMSSRDVQAVKAVSLVAAIFVICNFPLVVTTYATLVEPEFNNYRKYHNLYVLIYDLRYTFLLLSASGNMLVYYKYNTNYRERLYQVLPCKRGTKE
ncbi:uncharacterized protein LOC101852333 [Aplysia californica]|uniref:Uncharacterized protein LOC101852333 n=1 Tax=Aplysia californica TaxID=6500 RepID=A0ABM0JUH1_APLCA|nr:uncharacterized protein LOC101852333 [Aplysia californica]